VPSLQVRDLPEHIYQKIVQRAAAERRSVSQEAIVLLEKALEIAERTVDYRIKLVDQIVMETKEVPQNKLPDPVALVREDRDK